MPGMRRSVRLRERTSGADRVDLESGIIRGVKVLGVESKNGRRYPLATMRAAVGMYENAPVNLDHVGRNRERSVRDQIGWLRNVRVGSTGIHADLHVMRSHLEVPAILERAATDPTSFGLSHDADGDLDRDGTVTKLHRVRSVDLVASPATVVGLFESVAPSFGEATQSGYDVARRHAGRGWDPGRDSWRN